MVTASRCELKLRQAVCADLDNLARLAVEAFEGDPQWHYRYPLRSQFPEDNLYWTRVELKSYFDQPKKFSIFVTEITEEPGSVIPIALAIWDIAVQRPKTSPWSFGLDQRRDANVAHCRQFIETGVAATERYFGRYGNEQVDLWLLGTHPKYRRRGAGTMLVNWGIESTRGKAWPVTLIAGQMGKLLYTKMGFRELGAITIQVEGEDEKIVETTMEWSHT